MPSLISPDRPRLYQLLLWGLPLGFFSALALSASALTIDRNRSFSAFDFLQNFWAYAGCVMLALVFADRCNLQCFLVQRTGEWQKKFVLLLVYGVGIGIAMGLLYHRFFAAYQLSFRIPSRLRSMQTLYDACIVSLSAALTEEVVFRLLLFSAFLYILGRLFRPIILFRDSSLNRAIPLIFSVVFSALLFGIVHGLFGFLFAFAAGICLCVIFLRAGLEGAVLAHFLADFVFFSLTYLR